MILFDRVTKEYPRSTRPALSEVTVKIRRGEFVYVVGKNPDGQDIAAPRPVVVGEWSERDGRNVWLIDSGLSAGERVIVDGLARIMAPNSPVRVSAPAPAAAATSNPAPAPAAPAAGSQP